MLKQLYFPIASLVSITDQTDAYGELRKLDLPWGLLLLLASCQQQFFIWRL